MERMATQPDPGPPLGDLVIRLVGGQDLSIEEAESAFSAVMEGRATPVLTAALLVALRVKGETASEVAGGVRALRRAMVPVEAPDAAELVDTCGTGGGTLTTFNISTAAALLAAGAGVRIAKHGNRSFSSKCGSADVLAELGVRIELTPDGMAQVLEEAGIVFMFAPLLHPAMRHVAPVRRELGAGTVMNILGPLTNPARASRQVVGVADPALLELVAGALRELGHTRALVVHGQPGLDEISPLGATDVLDLRDGVVRRERLEPGDLLDTNGFREDELAGGDPAANAAVVRGVLGGELGGAARAAVTLNAGAALYVAGRAETLGAAVEQAEAALDAGHGLTALERLRDAAARAPAA